MNLREGRIDISKDIDIANAVVIAKELSEEIGFSETQQYMISTAVSELARNIVTYAMKGVVTIKVLAHDDHKGIEVVAEDNGPGIEDLGEALKDHYSTGGSLGLGLPGAKRLMDEFFIDSNREVGTKVIVRKWL